MERFGVAIGMENNLWLIRSADDADAIEIDSRRQDQAMTVIGMVAADLRATGGRK